MKNKKTIFLFFVFFIAFFSVFINTVLADEEESSTPCLFCQGHSEDLYKEDKQLIARVKQLKQTYGDSIDEVTLMATIFHREGTDRSVGSRYDSSDSDLSGYRSTIDRIKNIINGASDSGSDSGGSDAASDYKNDLLEAAALIMSKNASNGAFNESDYQKALASSSDSNICTFVEKRKKLSFFDRLTGKKALKSETFDDVCKNGYIGSVYDMSGDENQARRNAIAKDIIDLAHYYKWIIGFKEECVSSAPTGDFTGWKQYDSAWKDVPIGNSNIGSIGCLATSTAILMARSGTRITNLPSEYSSFNPGALVTVLNDHGGFTSGGGFTWSGYAGIAPNWKMGNSKMIGTSDNATLAKVISDELSTPENSQYQKFLVLKIHHNGSNEHWVAVDSVDGNTVKINDPGAEGSTLDENYSGWVVDLCKVMYATDVPFGQSSSSNSSVSSGSSESSKIEAADASKFKKRQEARWQHGDLPKDKVKYIMLHDTEAGRDTLDGIADIWTNHVAAHFVVDRDGNIMNTVPINKIAHHAGWAPSGSNELFGISQERDDMVGSETGGQDYAMNAWSIGIEIIHEHGGSMYTEEQLNAVDSLIAYLDKELDHKAEIIDHKYWTGSAETSRIGQKGEGKQDVDDSFPLKMYQTFRNHSGSTEEKECKTVGGGGTFDDLIEFINGMEGGYSTCRNGWGFTTNSLANDPGGLTASNGVTYNTGKSYASEVGYSSYDSDFFSGCVSKEKMTEIQKIILKGMYDEVVASASEFGINLTETELLALTSVRYGGYGMDRDIMRVIKAHGKDSYDVFHCFVSVGCGFGNAAYMDGLSNRRAGEYEVFRTGNFKAKNIGKGYGFYQSIANKSQLEHFMQSEWPTG